MRRVLSMANRRSRLVRLGIVVFALIVVVAPVLDQVAEAATSPNGPTALGLDLCTVAGAVLAGPVFLTLGESAPLAVPCHSRVLSPTPRVAYHPPRSL